MERLRFHRQPQQLAASSCVLGMGCRRSVAVVCWPKRCTARQGARADCIVAPLLLSPSVCRALHGIFTGIDTSLGPVDECDNDDSTMCRGSFDVEAVTLNVGKRNY